MYCLCTRCIIVNSVQVRSEFGKFAYTVIYMRKCTLWSDNTCVFTQFSLRKKPKYAAYLELWGVQHYVIKRRYIVAAIFFFIPTQLSILCKWQSKVVDPVDPFLHSFFFIYYWTCYCPNCILITTKNNNKNVHNKRWETIHHRLDISKYFL